MKTCKYCGKENKGTAKDVCGRCWNKAMLLPRFTEARDRVRRVTGMLPMKGRC